MKDHSTLWAQLEKTFQQDIPTTSHLLSLLARERKALESRDYDEFQKIVSQKQQHLKQLELHSAVRQQLLQTAGFNDEASTLNAAEKQAPIVAKAWRELAEEWAQCQQLNEVNERIAKRTKLVVGQILDMLRGQNNQAKIYTNKGESGSSSGGRTITSA
jgi:flagella synthesis protein FlgN